MKTSSKTEQRLEAVRILYTELAQVYGVFPIDEVVDHPKACGGRGIGYGVAAHYMRSQVQATGRARINFYGIARQTSWRWVACHEFRHHVDFAIGQRQGRNEEHGDGFESDVEEVAAVAKRVMADRGIAFDPWHGD
jgi:hypothetical protein